MYRRYTCKLQFCTLPFIHEYMNNQTKYPNINQYSCFPVVLKGDLPKKLACVKLLKFFFKHFTRLSLYLFISYCSKGYLSLLCVRYLIHFSSNLPTNATWWVSHCFIE